MGIIAQQSFKNTLVIFLGFAIGGLNVLFLYTHFLEAAYFGLVTFLLSTANIMMPLLVFGMQHTIIKFFSSYTNKEEQDGFLLVALISPLLIIIPIACLGVLSYEAIADYLSRENSIIKDYTYLIFLLAIFMGYFEVFYAWSRVQLKSVFGNFIKEIFARVCVSILLLCVFFQWINPDEFIVAIAIVYCLRWLIMTIYALKVYKPQFSKVIKPKNIKEIWSYSFYIILAGSAGGILLEIDKFMIPQMKQIAQVAYYSVGVYIASVIAIPSRAMQQIINPITAKALNNNEIDEVENLYQKSSDLLLISGGLLFLLINLNVSEMYQIIGKPEYAVGAAIVLIISVSELFKLSLGTNGAILTNSVYYKMFFYFSIAMALSVIILNHWLINWLGINGAALATCIVVILFGAIKVIYIKAKLKMQPYSKQTVKILTVILVFYILGKWIQLPFSDLVNLILKSSIIVILYSVLIFKLNISIELNSWMTERYRRIFNLKNE